MIPKINQFCNISEFENQMAMQSGDQGKVRAGKIILGATCMVIDSKGTDIVEKKERKRQSLEKRTQ